MLYKYIPYFMFKRLFGDRKKWGLKTVIDDKDFLKWQDGVHLQFYEDNQKGKLGTFVNNFGFQIMEHIDLTGKTVLEVGPGSIDHLYFNDTKPNEYMIADIRSEYLQLSRKKLQEFNITNIKAILIQDTIIPLEDNSIDILITFHQLEHIYPLEPYLLELKRVLKPNGLLVGAVPTEGSIAWGFGRYLTSRRYVQKYMDFDYDKIICWEHPNFVNKIQEKLNENFTNLQSKKKPFPFLPLDCNLSWSFIYRNDKE